MVNTLLWSGSCCLFLVPTTSGAGTGISTNREWEPEEQDNFFCEEIHPLRPCGQPQSDTDERHNEKPHGKNDNRTQHLYPMKTWKSFSHIWTPRWIANKITGPCDAFATSLPDITGRTGLYNGTNYGTEAECPVGWYVYRQWQNKVRLWRPPPRSLTSRWGHWKAHTISKKGCRLYGKHSAPTGIWQLLWFHRISLMPTEIFGPQISV